MNCEIMCASFIDECAVQIRDKSIICCRCASLKAGQTMRSLFGIWHLTFNAFAKVYLVMQINSHAGFSHKGDRDNFSQFPPTKIFYSLHGPIPCTVFGRDFFQKKAGISGFRARITERAKYVNFPQTKKSRKMAISCEARSFPGNGSGAKFGQLFYDLVCSCCWVRLPPIFAYNVQ